MKNRAGWGQQGSLAEACSRALIAGARSQRAGTRQQLRAAARRFVRRHGRDAGYMRWVLRSVGASSALSVALLGLAAAPALADLAPFQGPPTPVGSDVGTASAPTLGDLDGDGDLDLLAGSGDGLFPFYRNTGNVAVPAFASTISPLAGQDVGSNSAPAIGDLDGDGDLDLVSGSQAGTFRYFENTGSAILPAFIARTGAANPLNGAALGTNLVPTLGDLDGDGDLDVLAGNNSGAFFYFQNTGGATSPFFVQRTGAANPLSGQDIGSFSTPALGDLDRDGDLDLVFGQDTGVFNTFENTGNATSPAFVLRTGSANPLAGQDLGFNSVPALGDIDRDGDADLVAGDFNGIFNQIENRDGRFVLGTNILGLLPAYTAPALGDLDADGDADIVVGGSFGTLLYFENTGSISSAAFVEATGAANPMTGVDVGDQSKPTLGDLDADGDLDLAVGNEDGLLAYYENTGSAASPVFVKRTGLLNPLSFIDLGNIAWPAFGDVDLDGDLDLLCGRFNGQFFYFENTGDASDPSFVARIGDGNPMDGLYVDGLVEESALGDLDGDGDLDLVVGTTYGDFLYFETTVAGEPFVPRTGIGSPLAGADTGADAATPTLADLDADGDLDLVSGALFANSLVSFESFVVQSPRVSPQQGSANPLAGHDVGASATPALADLDADGDADLLAGTSNRQLPFLREHAERHEPGLRCADGLRESDERPRRRRRRQAGLRGSRRRRRLRPARGQPGRRLRLLPEHGRRREPVVRSRRREPVRARGRRRHELCAGARRRRRRRRPRPARRQLLQRLYLLREHRQQDAAGIRRAHGRGESVRGARPVLFPGPCARRLRRRRRPRSRDRRRVRALPVFQPSRPSERSAGRSESRHHQPARGEDVGERAAPAAADLDGDGDDDLVTGTADGTFAVHYMPEPAHGALLGAGAALARMARSPARKAQSIAAFASW